MFALLGIFFGLMASVPLGPINFFVASQALKRDFLHGVLAGATASFFDAVFCFVALAGFFRIKLRLPAYSMSVLKLVAAVVIFLLARKLIIDSKTFEIPQDRNSVPSAAPKPILGVMLLYLTNPTLYMYWIFVAGVVTGHNLLGHNLVRYGTWTAVAFAVVVGLTSFGWYMGLVRFISSRHQRIKQETFRRILFALGLALIGFAVYTLATVFI
ncbi:MAG TPA: LysE family transporter [Candidatus Aminicenantes bacterium]|nr:LysE family transporter [Candidatus Aminicenantes bacterium]